MSPCQYSHLLLDIGGVLISYNPGSNTILPSRTIKSVVDSPHWHQYERGKLSQKQCYDGVCGEFNLKPEEWVQSIEELKLTLTTNERFLTAIKHIKLQHPTLRIHALTNLSSPDYEILNPIIKEWDIFDSVITSAAIGARKPDLASYNLAQATVKAEARTTIFVDDLLENVITAQSLGLKSVHFNDPDRTAEQLNNLLGDPIDRAMEFLRNRSKNHVCETDKGVTIKDNFSQLLVLECVREPDLVALESEGPTWQFFIGDRTFTDQAFPNDSDTTSLAQVIFEYSDDQKQAAMTKILEHLTVDGYPLSYHDRNRPRFCPFICANVFRFFAINGQAPKLSSTHQYLCRILETQAYEFGSRYYINPDWILYYLSDVFTKRDDEVLKDLKKKVITELRRRAGIDNDVLGAAMRLIACQSLGIDNPKDLKTLLKTQQLDGGWEVGWLWNYGKVRVRVGSRSVPTAMAVKGIAAAFSNEEIANRLAWLKAVPLNPPMGTTTTGVNLTATS